MIINGRNNLQVVYVFRIWKSKEKKKTQQYGNIDDLINTLLVRAQFLYSIYFVRDTNCHSIFQLLTSNKKQTDAKKKKEEEEEEEKTACIVITLFT